MTTINIVSSTFIKETVKKHDNGQKALLSHLLVVAQSQSVMDSLVFWIDLSSQQQVKECILKVLSVVVQQTAIDEHFQHEVVA